MVEFSPATREARVRFPASALQLLVHTYIHTCLFKLIITIHEFERESLEVNPINKTLLKTTDKQ